MPIRFLINEAGNPFDISELQDLREELDSLDDDRRVIYRNDNASSLAQHDAVKFVIVSGPGTGKSHLFLDRIRHWHRQNPDAKIFVTSFVRKLVADLQSDIDNTELTQDQKRNITVSTLHKAARSFVERSHGTQEWRFRPHFRIIGQLWEEIIWKDVLDFHPSLDEVRYSWKEFREQLHNAEFDNSREWENLFNTYFKLCRFFNAAGFADLIIRARDSLIETPELNENKYFIIDEYQDFNSAEEELINQLIRGPSGLLIVGDDQQVLYEKLKSGKSILIRNRYQDTDHAKGMLPYCGRCSFNITKTAEYFIRQTAEAECIEKIYLPIKIADNYSKVQIIACATPATAVDYIEKFVSDNRTEINERRIRLAEGTAKDAFLLILTPAREVRFYREAKEVIERILTEYRTEDRSFSEDYYKILSYYSLANNPQNNFTFRKVLHYENIDENIVHELIESAMQNDQNLRDLEFEEITNAIQKCNEIKRILDDNSTNIEQMIENITPLITIDDSEKLKNDITRKSIGNETIAAIEHEEEEDAELEEIEVKRMNAIELLTIVGSKGLSADHVIIIGFDNVNMERVTPNAFYVAMTRARKSLHIITALRSGGAREAHRYINHLPEDHTEYHKYTKGERRKNQLDGRTGFINYLRSLSRH